MRTSRYNSSFSRYVTQTTYYVDGSTYVLPEPEPDASSFNTARFFTVILGCLAMLLA